MISVIIPARKERFLNKTIEDIQSKFKSEYEIIVVLDGNDEERIDGIRYILNDVPQGMRHCINQAVEIAKGKYIMKLDAHCMVDEGMDVKLLEDYELGVMIPTRKRLDAHNWKTQDDRPDINYMKLNEDYFGVEVKKSNDKLIDETEVFQGSCYLIDREFFKKCNLLDDINFNGTGHEAAEIAYKVRQNGGKVLRNKKTWYAHARLGRKYTSDKEKSKKAIKLLYDNLLYR